MPAGDTFMIWMDGLRSSLNRSLFLGLDAFEAQWPEDADGDFVIYDAHDVPRLTPAPRGGTLVLFMSEDTPHEARIATRERWSIAGWFRTRR